jgi:hypothetical protein
VIGEPLLLAELIEDLLVREGHRSKYGVVSGPEDAERKVRLAREDCGRTVALLVDPVGEQWFDWAARARRGDPVGLLVVLARPSYVLQRRWREKVDGRYLASGLLTLDQAAEDVRDAVMAAALTPLETGFWLAGPRHPHTHRSTPDGQLAAEIRSDEDRYRTLIYEGQGLTRPRMAELLGITEKQVGERLLSLRRRLDADNNVQLGRRATELGLFDDIELR